MFSDRCQIVVKTLAHASIEGIRKKNWCCWVIQRWPLEAKYTNESDCESYILCSMCVCVHSAPTALIYSTELSIHLLLDAFKAQATHIHVIRNKLHDAHATNTFQFEIRNNITQQQPTELSHHHICVCVGFILNPETTKLDGNYI